jgi:hypothetical protein
MIEPRMRSPCIVAPSRSGAIMCLPRFRVSQRLIWREHRLLVAALPLMLRTKLVEDRTAANSRRNFRCGSWPGPASPAPLSESRSAQHSQINGCAPSDIRGINGSISGQTTIQASDSAQRLVSELTTMGQAGAWLIAAPVSRRIAINGSHEVKKRVAATICRASAKVRRHLPPDA